MRFTLTIDADNAAFDGFPGEEVGRLLRVAVGQVDAGRLAAGDSGTLRDFNGNKVGGWTFGADHAGTDEIAREEATSP